MSDHAENTSPVEVNRTGEGPSDGRRTMRRRLGALLVVIAALALIGDVLAGLSLGRSSGSAVTSTISVTGSGTAHGTPDTVSFQIGINTVAKSASAALAQNNVRIGSLEASLIGHGVTRKNLQTSGLNIYENYDNAGNITGFTVSDELNVTLHQIAKAGSAIDAAANVAGNGVQLNGLSFSISNQSTLLKAARASAMRNAYTEATQIAQAGHASLGSIVRVTDQENSSSGPVYYPTANFTSVAKAASVPVEAGTQSINVQVSVVYALKG